MPSIKQRLNKSKISRSDYSCRICRKNHGLRNCQKFLKMDTNKRLRAVIAHSYCANCLAHHHSSGTCFSKLGCKHCGGSHHTLLHIMPKEDDKPQPKVYNQVKRYPLADKPKKTSKRPQILSKEVPRTISLSSITSPHTTILFPTAIVLVQIGTQQHHARAIIDTCTANSKISKKLVQDLNISTTTLGDDVICPVTIRSRQPPYITLETTMKVNSRLLMITPNQSIDSSISRNFTNLTLVDPEFYKSGTFSIVLGADLYAKIILAGMVPSSPGLPVAMNTIFGWVLSGSCSH